MANVREVSKDLEWLKRAMELYVNKTDREFSCLREELQLARAGQYVTSKYIRNEMVLVCSQFRK